MMLAEIDRFMDYLRVERNDSDLTVESYGGDIMQFFNFLTGDYEKNGRWDYEVGARVEDDDVVIDTISGDDIRGFIEYLFDRGLKKSSIERKISALKSFFKYLYNRDIIPMNPAAVIGCPKKEKHLPGFLYLNQVDKLMDFSVENFFDARDMAILAAFYSTGARVSELSSADIDDMDPEGNRLRVKGKGGDERIVFFTDETIEKITLYLGFRKRQFAGSDRALFVNKNGTRMSSRGIFDVVRKRARNAGLNTRVSPHTLRHSFATEMLNQGADIRAVQEMLGHRNLSTTQVYTHTTKERLRKVYDRFHPHSKTTV